MVSAGADHSMALTSAGVVWTWGQNNDGQLGLGTKTSSAKPVKVTALQNVVDIGNGRLHSLAIESDAGITGAFGLGGGVNFSVVLHS